MSEEPALSGGARMRAQGKKSILFWLQAAEYAELQAAALAERRTPTNWVKKEVLDALQRRLGNHDAKQ